MGKMDLVALVVTREQHRELELAKLTAVTPKELVEDVMAIRARDLFILVGILISQFGKEKAKELIQKAQYPVYLKRGKEAAEKAGHPKDIDGYIEANTIGLLSKIHSAPLPEIIERTKNRYVFRCTKCYQAESLLKHGAGDPEILEVVKYCCPNDTAWANGFNPSMKFERTKFLLDGDDYCEFLAEVE